MITGSCLVEKILIIPRSSVIFATSCFPATFRLWRCSSCWWWYSVCAGCPTTHTSSPSTTSPPWARLWASRDTISLDEIYILYESEVINLISKKVMRVNFFIIFHIRVQFHRVDLCAARLPGLLLARHVPRHRQPRRLLPHESHVRWMTMKMPWTYSVEKKVLREVGLDSHEPNAEIIQPLLC